MKGQAWKRDIELLARALQVEQKKLKEDVTFASSVDRIIENCPASLTIECLLRGKRPRSRVAIMKLSRTSSKRQEYRVTGVVAGKFRSVAPTGKDPVFDTVKHSEIISRLARARGTLVHLRPKLAAENDLSVVTECLYLVDLCRRSAQAIRDNILPSPTADPKVLPALRKENLWGRLLSREINGITVGLARAAVRLTIKSLWDWPECHHLSLFPTENELAKTDAETNRIILLAEEIIDGH